MPTTSANMGLTVPIASTGASGTGDVGPGYATNISTDLSTLIDAHDHSAGKGVQITPAGMNINADLTIANNNLTNLRGVRFTSQASALAAAGDLREVYVKSGDLWFVNAAGVQVQVTNGSGLATGPVGPTGPAGTAAISNYWQGGVTGATALALAVATPNTATVQWTNPLLTGGSVSQATSIGTGAAAISVTNAGLYKVDYQVGFTGAANTFLASVYQTINATGLANGANGGPLGGSAIAASLQMVQCAVPTGTTSVSASYLVKLAAGNLLNTWVSVPTGGGGALSLNPTGTLFTVAQVA